MAAIPSSAFLPARSAVHGLKHELPVLPQRHKYHTNHSAFRVQAAKLPSGVVVPKVEPKFKPAFLGFTNTAEIWNSRASMIGLIGVFVVELILNKGILQLIGVEIGKGLDLPL